jgi:phage terminase large subunit-like protein
MPWQRFVADVATELVADRVTGELRYAYRLVIVTVPRQSGKTTLDGVVLDHRALVIPRARVWFTMQSAKDAVDWLVNEHWPLVAPFAPEVALRRMAGSEHIKWRRSEGLIRPFPPNRDALHSKTSDLVMVDEAWRFDQQQGDAIDQAIVPTQATKADAQVWKVSTAGDAASTWWLGTVEAGRAAVEADRREGVAYFEWSCPDHLDPTAPASWPIYHPAYGRTVDDAAMVAALDQLGPDGFARAYGNRWVSIAARVIPLDAWRRARGPDEGVGLPDPGGLALGFDVAVDRSDAAIVAAWRDAAGNAQVEVADHRPGVAWIVDRLVELVDRWRPRLVAYDAAGPAIDVADAAGRRGVTLAGLKARDYAGACAAFLEGLTTEPPTITYRPHPALDAAAASAARRALGDAWAWGRRQSAGSLATLTASTVAVWGWDHAPPELGVFRIL